MYCPKSKLEVLLALSKFYTADGAYLEIKKMKENLELFLDILDSNNVERNALTLHAKAITKDVKANKVERMKAESALLDYKARALYEQKALKAATVEFLALDEAEKAIKPLCSVVHETDGVYKIELTEHITGLMLRARTEYILNGRIEPDTMIELSSQPIDVVPKLIPLLNTEGGLLSDPDASRRDLLGVLLPDKFKPAEINHVT